jgi:hypothetical protein
MNPAHYLTVFLSRRCARRHSFYMSRVTRHATRRGCFRSAGVSPALSIYFVWYKNLARLCDSLASAIRVRVVIHGGKFGGAEGVRTPDLLDAIEARSQLRHGPTGQMSDVAFIAPPLQTVKHGFRARKSPRNSLRHLWLCHYSRPNSAQYDRWIPISFFSGILGT